MFYIGPQIAPPGHRSRDESPGGSLSGLVVYEVAGRDAEFASELREALMRSLQAGAALTSQLRQLTQFDGIPGNSYGPDQYGLLAWQN
jgi:hypothetical protein